MGRKKGSKNRVRVTEEQLNKARKKIRETPKRGRWPKFDSIHPQDKKDFLDLCANPDRVDFNKKGFSMPIFYKNVEVNVNEDPRKPPKIEEVEKLSYIRFYCMSYNGENNAINDGVCRGIGHYSHPREACARKTCPYNGKGFITCAIKDKVFQKDIDELEAARHNEVQAEKEGL